MIDLLFGSKPVLWILLVLVTIVLSGATWLLILALDAVSDWLDVRRERRVRPPAAPGLRSARKAVR